jgi:hypothetical protein
MPTPMNSAAAQKAELDLIRDALVEILDAKSVEPWLQTPNAVFDGLRPLEVIERGEVDRIRQMIHLLRSGDPM